jgi:hypothetical protein
MAGATTDKGGLTTESGKGKLGQMSVTGPGLGASTGGGRGAGLGGPLDGFDFQPGKSGEAGNIEMEAES